MWSPEMISSLMVRVTADLLRRAPDTPCIHDLPQRHHRACADHGILESGRKLRVQLILKIADPDDELSINYLDVDELERHTRPSTKLSESNIYLRDRGIPVLACDRIIALTEADALLKLQFRAPLEVIDEVRISSSRSRIAWKAMWRTPVSQFRPKYPAAAAASCGGLREFATTDSVRHARPNRPYDPRPDCSL